MPRCIGKQLLLKRIAVPSHRRASLNGRICEFKEKGNIYFGRDSLSSGTLKEIKVNLTNI